MAFQIWTIGKYGLAAIVGDRAPAIHDVTGQEANAETP